MHLILDNLELFVSLVTVNRILLIKILLKPLTFLRFQHLIT
jgi:hypothetical protein